MKPSIKYGVMNGIIIGIFVTGAFSVFKSFNIHFYWGFQPDNIRGVIGLLTILIQGTGIYTGIYKVKMQQGTITYGEAFKTGFTMAIVTAVIVSLCSLLYCTVINPGYNVFMVTEARKAMIANGETADQMAKNLSSVRKEYSTGIQVMQSLVGQFVIGTLISLMIAPFLRTKKTA